MSNAQKQRGADAEQLAADLKERVCALVDGVVAQDEKEAAKDFEELVVRLRKLIQRKQADGVSKNEARDVLGEILFSRLRRGFRELFDSRDARDEIKLAEWIMGALVTRQVLDQLAAALDRLLLDAASPREFSFAGLTDFISIEEVLQLLGSGKHRGCLSLENSENRLDIYLDEGYVAFLDPHRLYRRLIPAPDRVGYREIKPELLRRAEDLHASAERVPIFLTLAESGVFDGDDLRERMRQMGAEILFDFLRERDACAFFYRRLLELPGFVTEHNLRMPITPILLEGNKRLDDWRSMCKVFPDPDAAIEPMPDLYSRISDMDLGVLEIKMLASCNGHTTARGLVGAMGLPLHEVYQFLVRLAKQGVIVPPGGIESAHTASLSMEESMEQAFRALDANEDDASMGKMFEQMIKEHADRSRDPAAADEEIPDWLDGA